MSGVVCWSKGKCPAAEGRLIMYKTLIKTHIDSKHRCTRFVGDVLLVMTLKLQHSGSCQRGSSAQVCFCNGLHVECRKYSQVIQRGQVVLWVPSGPRGEKYDKTNIWGLETFKAHLSPFTTGKQTHLLRFVLVLVDRILPT